jgi:hypothetical protein
MGDENFEDEFSGCLIDAIGLVILGVAVVLVGGVLYEAWKYLR